MEIASPSSVMEQAKMEIASPSPVMKQPTMESDSGDAWYAFSNMQKPVAELQEIVVPPQEEPQTEVPWSVLELLCPRFENSSGEWQTSSNQIHKELIIFRHHFSMAICLVQHAERYRNNIMIKLWVAKTTEVLNDAEDILYEMMDANIFRLTAEVQSSANGPWKLILNLFNKISRIMHYYRGKKTISKVKDINVRLGKILDEGTQLGIPLMLASHTPDPKNLGRKQFAIAMCSAIYKGKFWRVRDFFQSNPDAIPTTFEDGQTALQIAITAGQLRIAKELITITSGPNIHHLRIQDKNGNTALSLAARGGMMEIAKCLIEKNKDLLTIPDTHNKLPVQLACSAGHEDMTHYLYRNTSQEFLDGAYGFYLLEECITKKMFEIAADLLDCFPKFAIYRFFNDSSTPIILTFAKTAPFFRGNQPAFWRRWIYNSKKTYDLTFMDVIGRMILHFICRQLSALDENEFVQSGAVEATFQAIKNGIPEIAIEIAKVNTNILWNCIDPEDSRNMFACAVAHRQEEVAQFLYGFKARIGTNIVFTTDQDGNNLLHLAAKVTRSHIDHISGAARLQSELRWFNGVEGIVPQFYNYHKNNDGYTPAEVFVNEHKQLLKEAEEWVKKTAESCTVVGTLIITIMFAVAFTVPGGNDQNTGFPIFLNKTTDSSTVPSSTVPFMVFVVPDAISLFAASSSVLMFLGILASRYAYEDFFKSLPVKLIIGISSLFISIAAMMVAFCVALFIMLRGHLWIIIPVTVVAGIPIIIFVLLLSPFLVELYTMTFGPGIFDRKKNS